MKKIEFSESAKKVLVKLNKTLSKRILAKTELLNAEPKSLQIKKLKGSTDSFRIRIGTYRVIFEIQKDIILITKIGDRKDIYK